MSKVLVVYEFGMDISKGDIARWLEVDVEIGDNQEPADDGIALYREDKKVDWDWPDQVILVGTVVPPSSVNVTFHILESTDVIADIVEILNEIFGGIPDVDDESE